IGPKTTARERFSPFSAHFCVIFTAEKAATKRPPSAHQAPTQNPDLTALIIGPARPGGLKHCDLAGGPSKNLKTPLLSGRGIVSSVLNGRCHWNGQNFPENVGF